MPAPAAYPQLAVFLIYTLLQTALYTWLGRGLFRVVGSIDPWTGRVPELAFLVGWNAASLLGYAVLIATTSAIPVLPACVFAAAALHGVAHYRPRPQGAFPWIAERYRALRGTATGRLCAAAGVVFVVLVSMHRMWWLLGWTADGSITLGTSVWDDLRTIGFPLTIAAHGYPMRSPQALDTILAYPLGAFTVSAGGVALVPKFALQVILADVACGAAAYALVVLFAVAVLLSNRLMQWLVTLSGLISVSFNLWPVVANKHAPWFIALFGYFRKNGFETTVAWTPVYGTIWNQNHGIGFAAAVLAVLLFRDSRVPRFFVYLPALFAASASMDMTAMGLAGVGLWAILYRDRKQILAAAPIAVSSFLVLAATNALTLLGRTDFPNTSPFLWSTMPLYNIGVFGCTLGIYVLLLGLAATQGAVPRTGWMVPVLTGLLFSSVFTYYSIWYWRASLALHLLLAIWCGMSGERLRGLEVRRLFVALWAIGLSLGAGQVLSEVSIGYRFRDRMAADRREIYAWIQAQTRLHDRVAAYLDSTGVLAPDVDFLRTGNRAGNSTYDRDHPLVGYGRYRTRMSHMGEGIAAADYVVSWREAASFDSLLQACGAPVVFQNKAGVVYAVGNPCRNRIWSGLLTPQIAGWRRDWVTRHQPLNESNLRRDVEALWAKQAFAEAEKLLKPIIEKYPFSGEAVYLQAITLQYLNRCPEAILLHEQALANGYAEFWVRLNRGTCLVLLRQRDAAKTELLRARELRADHDGLNRLLEGLR
ncbi:MAG: hypothetical protein JNK87_35015 [Bryobacterales bacterium]|nr:hypothetical protein [Bryobacterales bacterium]